MTYSGENIVRCNKQYKKLSCCYDSQSYCMLQICIAPKCRSFSGAGLIDWSAWSVSTQCKPPLRLKNPASGRN